MVRPITKSNYDENVIVNRVATADVDGRCSRIMNFSTHHNLSSDSSHLCQLLVRCLLLQVTRLVSVYGPTRNPSWHTSVTLW